MAPQTSSEVPPWPGNSESTILKNIEMVKYTFEQAPVAVEKLNMLKNEILGDAGKAEQYAKDWSELQQTLVNEPVNDINGVLGGLDAYWTGNAKDSFNRYALAAVGTLNKDAGAFQGMANALGGCVRIVYSTYAEGVNIVGKLASDLVGLVGDKKLELIADLLQTFIDTTTALVSKSLDIIGQYKEKSVAFHTQAHFMQAVGRPDASAKDFEQWAVRPVS